MVKQAITAVNTFAAGAIGHVNLCCKAGMAIEAMNKNAAGFEASGAGGRGAPSSDWRVVGDGRRYGVGHVVFGAVVVVAMVKIPQNSTLCPTVLERLRTHRLPKIASIHARSEGFAAPAIYRRLGTRSLFWQTLSLHRRVQVNAARIARYSARRVRRRIGADDGFERIPEQVRHSNVIPRARSKVPGCYEMPELLLRKAVAVTQPLCHSDTASAQRTPRFRVLDISGQEHEGAHPARQQHRPCLGDVLQKHRNQGAIQFRTKRSKRLAVFEKFRGNLHDQTVVYLPHVSPPAQPACGVGANREHQQECQQRGVAKSSSPQPRVGCERCGFKPQSRDGLNNWIHGIVET